MEILVKLSWLIQLDFYSIFFFIIIILVSYEEKDLKYKWKSEVESDIFIYDKEMAQFDIISAKRYLKHKVYHSSKNLIPKHLSRNWRR